MGVNTTRDIPESPNPRPAPGWKKVIVSMMGIPGTVLGAIIGSAGVILTQPLLMQIALVMLILNGINLLTIYPPV